MPKIENTPANIQEMLKVNGTVDQLSLKIENIITGEQAVELATKAVQDDEGNEIKTSYATNQSVENILNDMHTNFVSKESFNNSSLIFKEMHINDYPLKGVVRYYKALDNMYNLDGYVYKITVSSSDSPSSVGYAWLFITYMDSGEHNYSQTLIDLDGQLYTRYMEYSKWTEWKQIGSGGGNGSEIIVDTVVDRSSNNPIANSAITRYVDDLEQYVEDDNFKPYSALWADTAHTAISDIMGNVIYETYVTKEDLPSGLKVDLVMDSQSDNAIANSAITGYVESMFDETFHRFDNINNGETVVGSANADANGNSIVDTYATKEEAKTHVKVWVPGKKYFVGDMVITQIQTEGKEKFYTVILQCLKDHIAPTDYMIPTLDELFSERWYYNEDYALYSKYDSDGNVIAEYYATKTEIGDIETSLDNIIINYGLDINTINLLDEIIDSQNEILEVTE